MDTNRKPHIPAARPPCSLYAIAKAITNFLFGENQFPTSLSRYAAFFAGLVTGAMDASTLYTYLNRSKCDRAKIQLAVYHIIRLFQHHPDYQALLRHPQELLERVEPEVLRIMDRHLTKNEADEVAKELKRTYEAPAAEEYACKRIREDERNGPDTAAARPQAQRGFLPELDPSNERTQEPDPTSAQSDIEPRSPPDAREPRSDTLVQDDNLDSCDLLTSDQKQLQVEYGQYDEDMVDLDDSSYLPLSDAIMTPCPHDRRSSAPSPDSSPAFIGLASTPTPAPKDDGYVSDDEFEATEESDDLETPQMSVEANTKQPIKSSRQFHRQGYGFSYDDPDLYPSSSSEEENAASPTSPPVEYTPSNWINEMYRKAIDLPSEDRRIDPPSPREPRSSSKRPPTVVAMVRGVKGRGTSLSPIPEGGSVSPRALDDQAIPPGHDAITSAQNNTMPSPVPQTQAQVNTAQAEVTQKQLANKLPFAHWSTTPEMTYSDSDESETGNKSPDSSVQATSPPSSPAAGSATPPSSNESVSPVVQQTTNISSMTAIHIAPTEEAQSAADGDETGTTLEPATTPPRRSAARSAPSPVSSDTPPPKENHPCSPVATAHQLSPREEQRSPLKKRKSASPEHEHEQEQTHASPPPPKRQRTSPLRDITTPHAVASEQPSPPKRKPSPAAPSQQPQKRSRGRGGNRTRPSPPAVPKTPTRKSTRKTAYEGAYTK